MKIHYAAIAPNGQILGIEDDARAAIDRVKGTVGGPITVQVLPENDPGVTHLNPPNAAEMPELSERQCQIPRIPESALAMSLEEAHELLKPFFDIEKRGAKVKKYNTPSGMADAWIGQNYKTEKPSQDPGRPAEVMGLTLVPAAHARLAAHGAGPYEHLFEPGEDASVRELAAMKTRMLAQWKDPSIGLPSRIKPSFTFCVGSSQECRDSCLIFTGQNAAERYNTYRKVAQTYALLHRPAAFMRMLVHSIELWLRDCTFYKRPDKRTEVGPFFRLNVLSDIPWERVAPWFFDYFAGKGGENGKPLRFYDYTKVPDRRASRFPGNYDLTFSLSGTPTNKLYAEREIEKYDSRIAVVFLAHKRENEREWTTFLGRGDDFRGDVPLPKRFWGMPVRDGDLSDVRPHDPGKVCVGLRWKIPSSKRSGAVPDYARMSFVTPIYVENANEPSRLVRPNPTDNEDLVLISAVSPRHQPIDQQLI